MASGRYINLVLGKYYQIGWSKTKRLAKDYKLIRTSPKSFNFLNEETNKCLLKVAMTAKGYKGIPHPKDKINFTFWWPASIWDERIIKKRLDNSLDYRKI